MCATVLQEGSNISLVWAYNSKEDSKSDREFGKHTSRGTSGNVRYVIADPQQPNKPKGLTHEQYQKQTNKAKQQQKQQRRSRRALSDDSKQNGASFDGGKYTVSWKLDLSSKKIRFKVEAQTKGWVAFGFAKQAPNSMKDYDVIVGGVLDSGQGYLYVSRTSFVLFRKQPSRTPHKS